MGGGVVLALAAVVAVGLLARQELQRRELEADLEATRRQLDAIEGNGTAAPGKRTVNEAEALAKLLKTMKDEHYKGQANTSRCREYTDRLDESQFYTEVVSEGFPAIFKNGIESMGKLRRWMDIAYLERKYGHTEHEVVFAFDDLYMQPWGDKLESPYREEMTLKDFLRKLKSARRSSHGNGSRLFIEQGAIFNREDEEEERSDKHRHDDHHPMMNDIEVPDFAHFLRDALTSVNFWLGSHGQERKKSALHFDSSNNLLVQLIGEKELVMFHPLEARSVYPKRLSRKTRAKRPTETDPEAVEYLTQEEELGEEGKDDVIDNFSPVLVDAPDTDRFPLFKKEDAIVCTLKPGDVLYLPAYTWHHVYSRRNESQGVNCALNFWFKPSSLLDDYHNILHRMIMEGNEGV